MKKIKAKPKKSKAPTKLGELVRQFRHERRLSQTALADAVDSTVTTINGLEIGRSKPRKSLLLKLANYFNYPYEVLQALADGSTVTETDNQPKEVLGLLSQREKGIEETLSMIHDMLHRGIISPSELTEAVYDTLNKKLLSKP